MDFEHASVLLDETIRELKIKPDGIYVDGTLGGGGHAFHVLNRLSEKGRYIGIDQDEDAIRASTKRLAPVWTEFFWILAFPLFSWMRRTGDSHTAKTYRWI